eukprot:9536_1
MNKQQRKKQKKFKKWMKKAHQQTIQINPQYRNMHRHHQLPKQTPVSGIILPKQTPVLSIIYIIPRQKKIQFDDLPDDIISKIASFLTITSYIRFEKTNNRITKILHNPYCLSLLNLNKSSMLSHSYKYNRITHLTIDISKMYTHWPNETTTKWCHIKTLSIKAKQISSNELFHILFSGAINFAHIKTLKIYDLQIDWSDFHQCTFLFPNVENLTLYNVYFSTLEDDESDNDIDQDDEKIDKYIGIEQIFPKLKALKMTRLQTDLSNKMCHVFGDKLCLLACDDINTIPTAKAFGKKLTEVQGSCTTLAVILKKSNNFKRVHMHVKSSLISKELIYVMSNLFKTQRLLECISILTDNNAFTIVIAEMTNELIKLREIVEEKKKGLKIMFDIGNIDRFDVFKSNVLKMVTVLDYYTCHDWMVIVSFRTPCNKLYRGYV